MSHCPLMIGLGEALWDVLPSGKVLGGAPANFAYMATVLGNEGVVASRLGNDELGHEALQLMQGLGLNVSYVQQDCDHETGTVGVALDRNGQPTFTIKQPVAWDFMQWTPAWEELSARADVVCFGSLAQRAPVSADTMSRFLDNVPATALRICDANLRQPFYNPSVLRKSFQRADIVKVNDDELQRLSVLMGWNSKDEETIARSLMNEFGLKLVCVTRGERGSLLVSPDRAVEHPGFRVKVADTVGAGDAFTACLAHYYLHGETLEEISERANRFGSWVASQVGATPRIQGGLLQDILSGVALG